MTERKAPRYDVAVLGAGLSGLYAARELLRSGLRVAVLEARDRVGGRTHSIPFHNDAYDIGGQWVGPGQHLSLALIQELGIKLKQQPWFAAPAAAAAAAAAATPAAGAGAGASFSSGCAVPLDAQDSAEVEELTAALDAMAASNDLSGPPWSEAARRWDATDCEAQLRSMCRGAGALREMLLFVQTVLAADPSALSFLYFLLYVRLAGGMAALGDGDGGAQSARMVGGAQQMSLLLARAVEAAGGDLMLEREVLSVEEVRGSPSQAGGRLYRVTAAAQASASAGARATAAAAALAVVEVSRVVVAMPAPVWRRIRFQPPLPEGHRRLAEGMRMGSCVKVLAIYPMRFWALAGDGDLSGGGGGNSGSSGAGAGGASGKRLEDCGPVANLFPGEYDGRPALVGLVTGADAVAFAHLPERDQKAAVLRQYKEYFGTAEAAHPDVFVVKEWMTERHSGGCFGGLMPPGLLTTVGAERAGARAGGVHFAGSEAGGRWIGYFEGALDAGRRAAEEVLGALRPPAGARAAASRL